MTALTSMQKTRPIMMMNRRQEVLSLYKQILRVGKNWSAKSGSAEDTKLEREYIIKETRMQFRDNKSLGDDIVVDKYIAEARSRLTIALHYKIPYPRPVNVKPMTYAKAIHSSKLKEEKKK